MARAKLFPFDGSSPGEPWAKGRAQQIYTPKSFFLGNQAHGEVGEREMKSSTTKQHEPAEDKREEPALKEAWR